MARLVLKDLAELDYRRDVSRVDSLTIVDLLKAYSACDSALTYSSKALKFHEEINKNQAIISMQYMDQWLKERKKRKAVTVGGVLLVVVALFL